LAWGRGPWWPEGSELAYKAKRGGGYEIIKKESWRWWGGGRLKK